MCKPHAWEECEEFQATFKAACIKSGGLLTFVDVVLYNVPGYGMNCFNAVMTKGLQGLGLPLPPSVRVHRDSGARHQALREHLRDMASGT